MTASDIFKDKKDNYPQSVPKLFVNTRLSKTQTLLLQQQMSVCFIKFNSMSPPTQTARTSTPRSFRLWATRR